jgi:hypothetical protein
MLESVFALYLSTRESPDQPSINGKLIGIDNVLHNVSNTGNYIYGDDKTSLVTTFNKNVYTVTVENKSSTTKAFIVDCNFNLLDIQKPCRVKVKIPEGLKQQIADQNKNEGPKHYNYIRYHNSVSFDVMDTNPLFSDDKEEVFLWKVSAAPSTPFIKNVVAMEIKPEGKIYFEVHFADISDLNYDGVIDAKDLSILLDSWGKTGGDINGDGTTDAVDQSMLLDKMQGNKDDE